MGNCSPKTTQIIKIEKVKILRGMDPMEQFFWQYSQNAGAPGRKYPLKFTKQKHFFDLSLYNYRNLTKINPKILESINLEKW